MVDSEEKAHLSPGNLDGPIANSPEKPDDKDVISGEKSSSSIDVEIENDENKLVDLPVKNSESTVKNDEKDSSSISENVQQLQENG